MDASALQRPAVSRLALSALALMALALSACVSTSIIDQWKDPSYSGPPLHKVLVVGVQKDQGRRRLWEDGMVAALLHQGVQASASWTVFPTKPPSADELAATARRDGFDGVMASHFVAPVSAITGCPATPVSAFGWGYYGYWDSLYGPGYVETEDRADYQTDVFTVDADGGKLIWTGITRSVDLSSTHSITDQISRVLVPALSKERILAGKSS